MSKDLAIIGASYLQLPLIEKAKEMGYTTHVFAWKANDVGETAADHFYPISIIEKDRILEKCRELDICGIASIASDLASITVNYVAHKMGLPCNSPEASLKSTNKYMMRQAFHANGDPCPQCMIVDSDTDLSSVGFSYPLIVKPTDRSGSRGIYKIDEADQDTLKRSVAHAIEESFEKKALIEEYIEGQEYSVEYISYKGKHTFLAMTLKYTTGAPCFIETGHKEPAPVDPATLERVREITEHALDTLGIENGASHTEIKIDKDNIMIVEIGGRMGGDCIGSDLVRYSTGLDFVKMVIDVACGKEPDMTPVCEPIPVESIFLFTQEDIDELERLKNEEPDRLLKIVDYSPENIGKTTDSSNRAGCYIRKFK